MLKVFLRIIIMVIIVLNPLCSSLFAAPTGGTEPIVDGSLVSLAGEYDYVFDRTLKSSDIASGKIKYQSTFYLKLNFKVIDSLNIYTKGGISDLKTIMDMENGNKMRESYNFGFYYGGGAKLIYKLLPQVRVALDGQLNLFTADVKDIDYGTWSINSCSGHINSWEGQLSGIVSYDINYGKLIPLIHGECLKLTPYVGATATYLEMKSTATAKGDDGNTISAPRTRKNKDKVGFIVGLDLSGYLEGFTFNLESRFLDETAISGNINYSF